VIHSGDAESQYRVAVISDKRTANTVEKIRFEGERLLPVKLKGKPVDMCIIQLYIPTSEHKEEEVDEMYERVEELLDSETNGKDYTIVMGDFNAVVGEGKEELYIGHYGFGHRNQRGEKLVDFCRRRQM